MPQKTIKKHANVELDGKFVSAELAVLASALKGLDEAARRQLHEQARTLYDAMPHAQAGSLAMAVFLEAAALPEYPVQDFLHGVIAELSDQPAAMLNVMLKLCTVQIDAGDFENALAMAWDMQALDSFNQSTIMAQTRALRRMGHPQAALNALDEAIAATNNDYLKLCRNALVRDCKLDAPLIGDEEVKAILNAKQDRKKAIKAELQAQEKAKIEARRAANPAIGGVKNFREALDRAQGSPDVQIAFIKASFHAAAYQNAFDHASYVLQQIKRPHEGLELCDRFIAHNTVNISGHLRRAGFLVALGREREAESCFDRVLRISPSNTIALTYKVGTLLDRQESGQAVTLIRAARDHAPQNMQILFIEARLAFHMRRFDHAASVIMPVIQNKNHQEAILLLMACTDQSDPRHRAVQKILGDRQYEVMLGAATSWRRNVSDHHHNPTQAVYFGRSIFNTVYMPFGINATAILQMAELPESIERAVKTNLADRAAPRLAAQERDTLPNPGYAL